MSVKRPAWGVYDMFETADDDRLFVGVVTDTQWALFCREFALPELAADPRLGSNGARVKERGWMMPRLAEVLKRHSKAALIAKLEAIGLPYAPIARPWDLLEDPHLKASGGLLDTQVPGGGRFHAPTLPLALDGRRLPKRSDPPAIGEGSRELLAGMGYADADIDALLAERVIALG
jgi:crotonobetainyl-CoA:carnitine CoA-transferase CaiB-like acyl-CoA transferase